MTHTPEYHTAYAADAALGLPPCTCIAHGGAGSGCQGCDPDEAWPQRARAVLCDACAATFPAGHALTNLHDLAARRVALGLSVPPTYAALPAPPQ